MALDLSKASSRISEKLDASRNELLDLGLRNPLLNHYPPRARGLAIDGGDSSEIFRQLVKENKSLSFLPHSEGGEEKKELKLETLFEAERLREVLLRTFYTARTCIEEQGVNTLFLSLGVLSWKDEEEFHRAPLLLLPVELTRSHARERFALRYTGEDPGINLSLMTKLRAEFGLYLPEIEQIEDLEPSAYFQAVAEAVRSQEGWTVEENLIFLDFFSFGKFLMYADLDEDRWPEGCKPTDHPIIRSLLEEGFREPPSRLSEKDDLDARLSPEEIRCVMDADSSQILAMLDVMDGRNLIIQGPPGTGKSQTIANILAEAVGRGKKILFVAEKSAALEVVKRRLDSVGLGDACLELHSHKTNKKVVLSEISRTLNLGRPAPGDFLRNLPVFEETRDRLNAYCQAVNTPIGPFTPFQVMGELLRLRREAEDCAFPIIPFENLETWSEADWTRRSNLVEELENHLSRMGDFSKHPFSGVSRTVFLPSDREALAGLLKNAEASLVSLRGSVDELAETLELKRKPETRLDCRSLVEAAKCSSEAPDLDGVAFDAPEWDSKENFEEVFEAGFAWQSIMKRFGETLLPEAWEKEGIDQRELLEIRQHLTAYGCKWWRRFSGDYRKAIARLTGLCQNALPASFPEQMALVDALLEARRKKRVIRQSSLAKLFPGLWKAEGSDWEKLSELSKITLEFRKRSEKDDLFRELDEEKKKLAVEKIARLEEALGDPRVFRLSEFLGLNEKTPEGRLEDRSFDLQEEAIRCWAEHLDRLDAVVRFNHLSERLKEENLGAVLELAKSSAPCGLVSAFRYNAFRCLLEASFRARPALARFDGGSHQDAIERFRDLDSLLLEHQQVGLADAHWSSLPHHEASGQLGVLRHEFEKKSRHLSIRQMMIKAGRAIQGIKPIFMMSPLSVATFLAPESITFDLVVFDEASQIKPVDAFGAILRGRQVVVVGDKKQLPPTDFFEKVDKSEEGETVTSDIESILGLFDSKGAPSRMLLWHYRSRHESLIAVSNSEFYDNRLVIFPSPDRSREGAGLILHPLPEAVYDLGNTRTNPLEAQAVAEAVMEHARTRPEQTLGVAAFSVAQMEAIQDCVEKLRREHSDCEEFFGSHPHEPFFIKNLETVQGDERDVIFISIGYGRSADNRLSMNFGPLNRLGGERRLNVLFTRARLRCEVFTNLSSADLDLSRSDAGGVKALKMFLAYAAQGEKVKRDPFSGNPSFFEEEIRKILSERGYLVESHVGVSGIFFDLAVVDPERPGRYLLGIECDGPGYQGPRSARDRDRLRTQVLEGLNWRIFHAWSADWLQHPEREASRLLDALEAAKNDSAESPKALARPFGLLREAQNERIEANVPFYKPVELVGVPPELKDVPLDQMVMLVVRVVDEEGPVSASEVDRRIIEAAGLKRVPARVQPELDAARLQAVKTGIVMQRNDFLWPQAVALSIRDRSRLPAVARRIELVCPEEISLAIEQVALESYGIEWERLPAAVCRLLGLSRPNDEAVTRIGALALVLIEEGKLEERGGYLQKTA